MDQDGSNLASLIAGPENDWDAGFNADGTKIMFFRHLLDADIWVMDAGGGNPMLLLGGASNQDHPT